MSCLSSYHPVWTQTWCPGLAFMYKTFKYCCVDKITSVLMRNVKFTLLISWLAVRCLVSSQLCTLIVIHVFFWPEPLKKRCESTLFQFPVVLRVNLHLLISTFVTSSWNVLHYKTCVVNFWDCCLSRGICSLRAWSAQAGTGEVTGAAHAVCYLTCGPALLIPSRGPVQSPACSTHASPSPSSRCVRADLWTAREKQMRLHRNTFLAARKDSCYGNHLSPSQLRNPMERSVCVCACVLWGAGSEKWAWFIFYFFIFIVKCYHFGSHGVTATRNAWSSSLFSRRCHIALKPRRCVSSEASEGGVWLS